MKRILTLGVTLLCALLISSPPVLAGPVTTPPTGPALLPPPSIEWQANAWTVDIEISRALKGGSGTERAVGAFRTRKLCNGGGSDDGNSEAYQSCSYHLAKTTDTAYTYIFREFSSNALFVRRTDCEPMNGSWLCTRKATP